MIPALLKLMDQMKDVLGRLEKLEKDSHPPQPVITGEEFDQYKDGVGTVLGDIREELTSLSLKVDELSRRERMQ